MALRHFVEDALIATLDLDGVVTTVKALDEDSNVGAVYSSVFIGLLCCPSFSLTDTLHESGFKKHFSRSVLAATGATVTRASPEKTDNLLKKFLQDIAATLIVCAGIS